MPDTKTKTKILVMYPRPTDVAVFERRYAEEHMPLARKHLRGASRLVFDRDTAALAGDPAYYHIAEIHFDSIESMKAAAQTAGVQETLANAVAISSGGPPTILVVREVLEP